MTTPCEQKEIIQEIRDDIKSILKMLNGNGGIGLCAKVTILWRGAVFIVVLVVTTLIKVFWK